MSNSQIPTDKVDAYLGTRYDVMVDDHTIHLTIGEPSVDMAEYFQRQGVASAALITAFNPFGAVQADDANAAANQKLEQAVREDGLKFLPASGSGEGWPAEPGFWVLGIELDRARSLGKAFSQDAIVWMDLEAIPRLILLR
ncbi:DUF3293 domain-containing protein [Asticcacaulis sp. AC402]|uniref:DUF3293 domain-containing protein n=1 Tax=Asticcacaulis sp. AC402 TaxID=1282361 RepID=UPI0003C3CEF4|nr:DUF3293 domain-containing protein [Asticcacaulis sp. AC402]ESQ73724.1 hypothetical protein ABAC402_17820 [Asticcacaulis sp. AC402]